MFWQTIISTVTKWVLHLLASVGLVGLAWCSGHSSGVQAQKAKDAPVIVQAKAAAATGQAQATLTQQTLVESAKRSQDELTTMQKADDVSDSIQALVDGHDVTLPADVDARWRAGIGGLRGDASAANRRDQPSGVLGGPDPSASDAETSSAARPANHRG